MKKTRIIFLFTAVIGLLSSNFVNAQDPGREFYKQPYKSRNSGSFDANTNVVNLGIGVPNELRYNDGRGFGPMYLKYEHGILDEIGIGGEFSFAAARTKRNNNNKAWRRAGFNVGILGYYHFNKLIPVEKLDVYVGVGLGTQVITYSNDFGRENQATDASAIGLFKVGARWYFTPGFGVYLESGYDAMSSVNLGLSFRF